MHKRYIATIFAAGMLSSLYADEGTEKKEIPVYENRVNFYILRLGYEHIKPDDFYVGIEGWRLNQFTFKKWFQTSLVETEGRVGYNFRASKEDVLTPFIGGGYFRSYIQSHQQKIGFGSLGIRYEHEFNKLFTLGVNAEGMLGRSLSKERQSWGNPVWGFDVSVPLTFRFTKMRNWDFRFEPFVTDFFGKHTSHIFAGTRSSFGYRF